MTAGWHGAHCLAHRDRQAAKPTMPDFPSKSFSRGPWSSPSYTLQFHSAIHLTLQHPSMLPFIQLHLSHPLSPGILLTSVLPLTFFASCLPLHLLLFVLPLCACARGHHGSTKEVCFCSSSILILLAPSPMPMPAPAQVLTGWHCANLPPPSLSFVAHPSVALPPVSTFPSLSLSLISFTQFLNHLPSL